MIGTKPQIVGRIFGLFLLTVFCLSGFPGNAQLAEGALEPASSGGIPALDRALERLATHHRMLMIAAHPDDEDTALLTWVARARGGEAAYLSLSRGEGGQNLIGTELGDGLGLLRSRELLAARRIDGARQFFSRAFDFGYTRSVNETFDRWPKQALLEDTVRVIRRFKPQVLVAVFPPDTRAGHGQHQASGVIAEEVLALAADPTAFPHLLDEGLPPWQVTALYRRARRGDSDILTVPTGEIDPWTGRSIAQIARESRSQHRCQDMGSLQPLGDSESRLIFVSGHRNDAFFSSGAMPLSAIALLGKGALRAEVVGSLLRVEGLANQARRELDAFDPHRTAPTLAKIVALLDQTREVLSTSPDLSDSTSATHHMLALVEEKQRLAWEALATAAGVLVDAISEQETIQPSGELGIRSFFWNAGPFTVEDLDIEPHAVNDWQEVGREPVIAESTRFSSRVDDDSRIRLLVPDDNPPTVPYFLQNPKKGFLYDWSQAPAEARGEPFEPPPLLLSYSFRLLETEVFLVREVVHRFRDQARGEVRRPLRVVPSLELRIDPPLLVLSKENEPAIVGVEVRSNLEREVELRVEIQVPPGWPRVSPIQARLEEPHGALRLEIPVEIPADAAEGRYSLELEVVDEAENRYGHSLPLVDYEHVRPTPGLRPARLDLALGTIKWPELRNIGYVRGASDRVPESLHQVGAPIEVLPAEALLERDLSVFEAIVIGSRAFEVEPALAAANARLLDFARRGGLVIVQYQQYFFSRGDFAPFPFDIDRPHDRVTDETAQVRLLDPEHPLFQLPNQLRPSDWDGWVQERGLYFAGTWDPAYQPLLAMADPGGEEQQGGLLLASVGEGTWVYTGLAFFRQLPAGVLGAYRLFANLLGLAKTDVSFTSAKTAAGNLPIAVTSKSSLAQMSEERSQ